MPSKATLPLLALLLLLLVRILACSPVAMPSPTTTESFAEEPASYPTATSRSQTVASLPTFTPRPPTITPTYIPTPSPNPFSCRFSGQIPVNTSEPLQNVVLFTRDSVIPSPESNDPSHFSHLWAVSPDGRQFGRLTTDDQSATMSSLPGPPESLLLLAPADLLLKSDLVQVISLPVQCERQDKQTSDWRPCSDFAFSPDRRYVAFFWGWYACFGREGVIAIDLFTGTTLRWTRIGIRWFQFLPDGRILIANSDCEGGEYIWTWNIEADHKRFLGSKRSRLSWNVGLSAFATEFVPLPCHGEEYERVLWVYNRLTDQVTEHIEGENGDFIWTPEGDYLLYHHRAVTKTWDVVSGCPITITYGPREIYVIESASGNRYRVVGDLEHDYHLDRDIRGEWVSLRRIDYRHWVCPTAGPCNSDCIYGQPDCPEQVEHLALNWRTGELLPWDQSLLPEITPVPPTPTSTSTPVKDPSPDMASTPIYTDPWGRYALYVETDNTSLWCVQEGEEPVLWIDDGHNFTYVP